MDKQDQIDNLSCEIATLVYEQHMINCYGIASCNINFTEGDMVEKILRRGILKFGVDCEDVPERKEALMLEKIFTPNKSFKFPVPPPPNPMSPRDTVFTQAPVASSYQYIQPYPLSVWTINHNLGFPPNVTIVDQQGNVIDGIIQYLSQTSTGGTITVTLSEGVAGNAYLS